MTPDIEIQPTTPPSRVLFVDDEAQVRTLFRAQLGKHGYEVDLAETPSQAVSMAARYPYSVVATDMRMPEMDGIELIGRLQGACPGTATVLISGDRGLKIPDDQWIDRTLVSVIPKPWNLKELLAVVSRAQQITARRASQGQADSESTACKVLLVEANPERGIEFTRNARHCPLKTEVVTVQTLAQATEAIEAEAWSVAVINVGQEADGNQGSWETVRRLASRVPTVLLGSAEERVLVKDRNELGVLDFLVHEDLDGSTLERVLRYAIARREAENELVEMSNRDVLTRLGNRSFFRSRLKHGLANARRKNTTLAVMFLDLDRFKEINDGWGHYAGDTVLSEVGARLENAVPEGATLARLGGDEFAVMLEDVAEPGEIEDLAQQIRSTLSAPYRVAGEAIETSPSVGIALFPDHGNTEEKLLRLADKAMYRAKNEGGARVCLHEGADNPRPARFLVERELRQALERNEFVLHYQPQLDLATGEFCAVEALIRWIRPNGEMVPPGEFIGSLEETGQIRDVGAWVLDTSCRQLAAWRDQGLDRMCVSFNVSPRQFEDGRLPGLVERALATYCLDAGQIEVEITEAVMIKDTTDSRSQIERLRALGVSIAIDDFGTGYSSLAYLHKFPVDVLKMDRSFIGEIEQSEDSRTLVELIIALAHKLNLEVVAEGVETAEQLKFLRREGCDRTQGYFHSRPIPKAELVEFLGVQKAV